MKTHYQYTAETELHANQIPARTVAAKAHRIGMEQADALIVAMDCLIKIAKAHEFRFNSKLSEDYLLGPEWLAAAKGLRGLLNGNAEIANLRGLGCDSKDNGACEGMFWGAMRHAGYTEADL